MKIARTPAPLRRRSPGSIWKKQEFFIMGHRVAFGISLLTVISFCCCGVFAQAPANDTCGAAVPIGNGTVAGTTVMATTGPDPVGTCAPNGKDVWYVYTSTCSGPATASLCPALSGSGTFDTVMTVWDGSSGCGGLFQLACNDDTCGLRSQVSWTATVGTVYYISIGVYNSGAEGTFVLSVNCTFLPTNDTCATAIPITEGAVTPGFNFGATIGPDPIGSCVVNSNDVWYSFTPACTGPCRVMTCAPVFFDSVVSVWSGTCGALTQIGCDDDGCGATAGPSKVTFNATAGTTYYISVAGWTGATGNFQLRANTGSDFTLTFNTGPGSIGYTVAGGPTIGGSVYAAITLTPGLYPFDWFFGIGISLPEVMSQITFGFPFVGGLSACGDLTVGPFGGLPFGLTVYGVGLGFPSGASLPTMITAPATGTVQ